MPSDSSAFFSAVTTSYSVMVLLNGAVFAVSGFLGLSFLLQTLHRLSVAQKEQDALATTPAVEPVGGTS